MSSGLTSLDEFHANPRLRFQLLLREQGVVVTLFDAMETVRGLTFIWTFAWSIDGMGCSDLLLLRLLGLSAEAATNQGVVRTRRKISVSS